MVPWHEPTTGANRQAPGDAETDPLPAHMTKPSMNSWTGVTNSCSVSRQSW